MYRIQDTGYRIALFSFLFLVANSCLASNGIGSLTTDFKQQLSDILSLISYAAYFSGVWIALKTLVEAANFSSTQHADGSSTQSSTKTTYVAKMLMYSALLLSFGWVLTTLSTTLSGAAPKVGF